MMKKQEEKQEHRKRIKETIPDEEILSYRHLISDYMKYIELSKMYLLEYEDLYQKTLSDVVKHTLSILKEKSNKNLIEKLKGEIKKDELDKFLLTKKEYVDHKIKESFNKEFYADIHKRLEAQKPVNDRVITIGTNYRSNVTHGSTYLEMIHRRVKESPSGWKLHLSVDKNSGNLEKSLNVLSNIILKHELSYAKISHFNGNTKPGTEITIYQAFDIDKAWDKIIEEIEMAFKSNGVRPSSRMAEGDKIVSRSDYITYRNDSFPGIKGTFRPEHIKESIGMVEQNIIAGKNDSFIIQLLIEYIKSKYKILDEDTVNIFSRKLVENVKSALSKSQSLSELEYNPFNMEDNPNKNVNLERRQSLNSR